MVKDKEWLEEELSKLIVFKEFSNRLHNKGHYPVIGKYNAVEVNELVSQLGEPIDEGEKQELF